MTDAAVLQRLDRIERMLEQLVQQQPQDPRHVELLDCIERVFGTSPFTACEVIAAAHRPMGDDRRRLQAALQALGALSPQKLGMTLSSIQKAYRTTRLVRLGTEGGKRLWSVDLVEPGC